MLLLTVLCIASSGFCFSIDSEIWWNLANPTEPRWEWLCLQFRLIDSSVPNE
ncbi:hypothetical protein BAE44_0022459 [Dichanthelium oligosanthes]|uniref:Uncharacterized protein n=1 Tax=Dichanthelium oligosanthes TaxID=888268 RepID=A0A1E5UUH3_9POAL|nr:hypothetical protein BAE44_0022459 [Dichanthelium oligosanthes]